MNLYMKKLTLSLGINSTYKGFHYLLASLKIALEDPDNLFYITKNIFPRVAKHYNTSPTCVERDIRTVIQHCWHNPSFREALVQICPYPLSKSPTVSEFIDILFSHVQQQLYLLENQKDITKL